MFGQHFVLKVDLKRFPAQIFISGLHFVYFKSKFICCFLPKICLIDFNTLKYNHSVMWFGLSSAVVGGAVHLLSYHDMVESLIDL